MSCEHEYDDCKHIGTDYCNKCYTGERYAQVKQKSYGIKKTYAKNSKRMGSTFEMNNHIAMSNTVKAVSTDMTPNSGAGKVKGDQQITGILETMEELKTQEVTRARGHAQFTIKREWLDKLAREAPLENKEFWYLKFAFCNTDDEAFVVIDAKMMADLTATLIHDRLKAKEADNKVDVANKKYYLADAENAKLRAEIEYYKALLKKEGVEYE